MKIFGRRLQVTYRTQDQKENLVLCFGLTGPHLGSDATSLIGSNCVVEEINGELGLDHYVHEDFENLT